MQVAALTKDGTLDTVFAGSGKKTIPFASPGAQGWGFSRTPDGKIVVAGGPKFSTARFFDRAFSTVSIASFDPYASETGPDPATFIVARAERLSTPLRVYLNVSGTARRPGTFADYSGTNITFGPSGAPTYVDIAAGQTYTVVTITPIDDTRIEGDETAIFSLVPQAAYDNGGTVSATLVIRDNDTA